MPSILTHYGFNKFVYNKEIKFLKDNEDIYLLGAQGPDPFFFFGIIPFCKNKNSREIRNYGSKLHKTVPNEVFNCLFEYSNNSVNKDILYAYILGAGLHYLLDRKIHPYVYYNTGFSDDKKKKKKYFVNHTLFETNIDVLLINGIFDKYKVKPNDSIKCDIGKVSLVSCMYEYIAKNIVVDTSIDSNTFKDAYKQMLILEKLLYSKRGIKKSIVKFLFNQTPFNTMMHSKVVKDDRFIDYLNLKKREWKDPSLEISCNKSVLELIEEVKEETSEWYSIVNDYYENKGSKERLNKFVNGIIYDGYSSDSKMKVFLNIFEKGEK